VAKQTKSGLTNEKVVRDKMRKLKQALKEASTFVAMPILKKEADRFQKDLVSAIANQTLRLKPLSRPYKAYKKTMGLDPRILIATGKLLNAYMVEPLRSGRGYAITVARRKQKGVWLSTIDRAHEYGTGHLPARPHWRPVIAKFKTRKQEVALAISQELAKQVRVRVAR
jgi:hypothetical protein